MSLFTLTVVRADLEFIQGCSTEINATIKSFLLSRKYNESKQEHCKVYVLKKKAKLK